MVQAKLKWQKQKFEIEIDPAVSVAEFKASVFSLTGVPVDRQKLTCPKAWKGQLGDGMNLAECKLKDGITIMLIGSADVMAAQTAAVQFIEDMKEEEVAAVSLPVGFRNLGNTCYMNSTLQCLRFIPELQEGLRPFARLPATAGEGNERLTAALSRTFDGMGKSTQPFHPTEFWSTLKQIFPQFGQTTPQGMPMQQDAEELYSSTTSALASTLKDPTGLPGLGGAQNLVDALFGLEMEESLTCDESPDEPTSTRKEISRKLVCNIQGGGGSAAHVDHLHEGVMLGLKGTIEKNSELLGRNALWTRTQRINRLPRIVCVQFMRFYWKEARVLEEGREVVRGQKCKIMRPVSFPEVLDVYNFCNDRVQGLLKANRDRHGDEIMGDLLKKQAGAAEEEPPAASAPQAMDVEGVTPPAAAEPMDEEQAALEAALKMSMAEATAGGGASEGGAASSSVESVGPGIPPDFQGNYELFGVVTHKGRFADGGHYMGWVRQDGDDWLVFDDDEVSPCKTENVLSLKGGGDSDMAYLAFYRMKN